MTLMSLDGYQARIIYNPESDQFRGEILGLSGGAEFYGSNPDELRREFKQSLEVYLEVCRERGVAPRKQFSGRFNLRIPPDLHEQLTNTELLRLTNQWGRVAVESCLRWIAT